MYLVSAVEKDILKEISNRTPLFSKGQRKIAKFILDHYDEAAYMNASMLGSVTGVSESTVVRFATALGFQGYPDFLRELNETVKSKLTSVQRVGVGSTMVGEGDVVKKVMRLDADCVNKSISLVDREDFSNAVASISKANHIYIIGARSSSALAVFLNYYLSMMFKNVKLLMGASSGEIIEQIHAIDEEDVIIGISFPRYSSITVKVLEYAKRKNSKAIAITDSELSPISRISDYKLYSKCEIMSFVDSLVSPLSVINALLLAIGIRHPKKLNKTFSELEELWEEHEVYNRGKEAVDES